MTLTWIEKESIKTKVFESVGMASMCWTETPEGVFDSTKAQTIGNELFEFIVTEIETHEEINNNYDKY